jgi:hypothetical protein
MAKPGRRLAFSAGSTITDEISRPSGASSGGRRLKLRLATRWPWTEQITTAITRLQGFEPG